MGITHDSDPINNNNTARSPAANARSCAQVLSERTLAVRVIGPLSIMEEKTMLPEPSPTKLIISPDRPRLVRPPDLLDQWDAEALAAFEARKENRPLGVCTGLKSVDAIIGGFLQPGLHSIQGGPGVGKTAFVNQLASCCTFPALMVSCEMSLIEILRRITARVTGTYLGKFKDGELAPDVSRDLVRKAVSTCPVLGLLDGTRDYIPAFAGENDEVNIYDAAVALRKDSPHVVVVVDSLHSWAEGGPGATSEYERLNAALASLRALAAELSAPVIVVTERNREAIRTGGVSAGAGTRRIEYSAESVIELDVNDSAPGAKPGKDEKKVVLKLSKNRNGHVNQPVSLLFHGGFQRYREA